MHQGYVVNNGDDKDFRLRHVSNRYILTTKTSTDDPTIRIEEEREILEEDFAKLWTETQGKRIKKTRYQIPHDQPCKTGYFELDIFKGKLKELHIVEIEFNSIEEANKFIPPQWFGKEVTDDKRYRSKNLAINGIPRD